MNTMRRSLVIGSALCLSALAPPLVRAGMNCFGTLFAVDPSAESPPNAATFVHTVTSTNKCTTCSFIDNVLLNEHPNKHLFVTPSYNPGGGSGMTNPYPISVGYNASSSPHVWSIFNTPATTPTSSNEMPVGMKFNVRTALGQQVQVGAAQYGGTQFYLNTIGVGDQNALLSVMNSWSTPSSDAAPYRDVPGVRYDPAVGKWVIFNLLGSTLDPTHAFNVRNDGAFVHTVTNTTYFSPIMVPMATVPDAEVFVTPTAQSGTWNPAASHHVAVKYSGGRWGLFFQDLDAGGAEIPIPQGTKYNIVIERPSYMMASSPISNYTYVDDSLADGDPDATVFVTAHGEGADNPHCTGVWYDAWQGKWAIFNEDLAQMPIDAAFNVKVTTGFVHVASGSSGYLTYIDHPATNGNPSATLTVTQNWNPSGRGYGVYNASCVGVRYDQGKQMWAIVNGDLSNIPVGAAFNVLVETAKVVSSDTSSSSSFTFSDPYFDGDPEPLIFVTPCYEGSAGQWDGHPLGVRYDIGKQLWQVFHPDGTPMSYGSTYNVAAH